MPYECGKAAEFYCISILNKTRLVKAMSNRPGFVCVQLRWIKLQKLCRMGGETDGAEIYNKRGFCCNPEIKEHKREEELRIWVYISTGMKRP